MTAFERGVNNGKSQSSDGEFPSLAAVGVGKRYRLTRGVGGYLDAVKDDLSRSVCISEPGSHDTLPS